MHLLSPNTLIVTALATASLAAAAPVDIPGPGPIVGHSHGGDQTQQSRQLVAPAVGTPTPLSNANSIPPGAGPRCGILPDSNLSKRDRPTGVPHEDTKAAAIAIAGYKVHKKKPAADRDDQRQRRGVDADNFAVTMGGEDFSRLAGFFNSAEVQPHDKRDGNDGEPDRLKLKVQMSMEDYAKLSAFFNRARVHHKRSTDANAYAEAVEELQRRGLFKDIWDGFTQKHDGYRPWPAGTTNRHDAIPSNWGFWKHKEGWLDNALDKAAEEKAAKEASLKQYGQMSPP